MIPSKKWFPTSLQDRAAWFQNFATQFAAVFTALGFVSADNTAVQTDNEDFQSIAATTVALGNFSTAVREYRISLTEGDVGDPQPMFPTESFAPPPNDRPAGIFERLDNMVKRIRVAPAFTDEIGASLGINPTSPEPSAPDQPPVLDVSVDPGNVVLVKFVRGGSDGIFVEISIDKGPWTSQGSFIKSPAILTIPQNTEELPRQVQVRARFMDGNNPVGDWSDSVTVQTIP